MNREFNLGKSGASEPEVFDTGQNVTYDRFDNNESITSDPAIDEYLAKNLDLTEETKNPDSNQKNLGGKEKKKRITTRNKNVKDISQPDALKSEPSAPSKSPKGDEENYYANYTEFIPKDTESLKNAAENPGTEEEEEFYTEFDLNSAEEEARKIQEEKEKSALEYQKTLEDIKSEAVKESPKKIIKDVPEYYSAFELDQANEEVSRATKQEVEPEITTEANKVVEQAITPKKHFSLFNWRTWADPEQNPFTRKRANKLNKKTATK